MFGYGFSPAGISASRRLSLRGFTLQEMLITLCIGGLLAGAGIGMWNAIQRSTIVAAANELASNLALARTQAIERQARVVMCPTTDGKTCSGAGSDYTFWQEGWMVYVDQNGNAMPDGDEIVRIRKGDIHGVHIRTSRTRSRVTYRPLGTSGGSTITFAVCGERDPTLARYVIVSNVGRARVSQTTTSAVRCG